MSFALIALVMSIAVALGLLGVRALMRAGLLHHLVASSAAPRFAHPAGCGRAPRVVMRRDGLQEGWALIERALRARHAVKFDIH